MQNGVGVGRIVLGVSCLLVLFGNGCAQPVKDKAHDLGSAFSGSYDTTVAVSSADVISAVRAAIDDLHLILINQTRESDDSTAIVIARSSADEKVTVTVSPQTPDTTRFTVSTGVFGDSTLRQQVMDAIKLRLGNAVIKPITAGPTTTGSY